MAAKAVAKSTQSDAETLAGLVLPELVLAGQSPVKLASRIIDCPSLSVARRRELTDALAQELPGLPDPMQALLALSAFLDLHAGGRELTRLLDRERLPQILKLFSFSPGLGKALLRHPALAAELFPVAKESVGDFRARLAAVASDIPRGDVKEHLRLVKLREFIRIAMSDFLGLDDFEETTEKISLVADCCVQLSLAAVGVAESRLCVIAMGKWGGLELNYSSDIDLLFVADDGLDDGEVERLHRAAAIVIEQLGATTADGFVFRVDSRLRPEGAAGSLVKSLRQYLNYFQRYAKGWEFQALVKARHGAGDGDLAAKFIRSTRPFVYHPRNKPEKVLVAVRQMKGKIERALKSRHTDHGNVKLGVGGIRDIEFIVQFLQLHHGRLSNKFRDTGTLAAMKRFLAHRIISEEEHQALRREYIFLRTLEHALQITRELPVRRLPAKPFDQRLLARKMGFENTPERACEEQLLARYGEAVQHTRRIFNSFFDMTIFFLERKARVRELCPGVPNEIIEDHFSRLESDYFLRFGPEEIAAHIEAVTKLGDKQLCEMSVDWRPDRSRRVTIVAFDYLGEFANICGLLSAYGQNIIGGESYTYSDPAAATTKDPKPDFYRRPTRRYYKSASAAKTILGRRKIVCVADVRPHRHHLTRVFSWNEFHGDLEETLGMLRDGKENEASERVTLAVMNLLKASTHAPTQRALLPVEFHIDNDSDDTYTILEIHGADQFMFLFEFTNALATRNYYIGKVEIATEGETVHDRLLLTTRDGHKIDNPKHLQDLRATISLIKQFGAFLPQAPNPHLALRQFSHLVDCVLEAGEQGRIPIIEQEQVMTDLARVLGASSFLWEDFLRMQHESLLPIITNTKMLDRPHNFSAMDKRLKRGLAKCPEHAAKVQTLNDFKDREMFRIDLRHLSRRVQDFTDFCGELSDLADMVLRQAYKLAVDAAADKFGRAEPGTSCIVALGKWGGRELGYASDIEIIFVADYEGEKHPEYAEYYEFVAQGVANSMHTKRDGIFELDFRLRPGGKNSYMATPWRRFEQYFSPGGGADTYERQALVRLRAIGGDLPLRHKVEAVRRSFVFGGAPFDLNRIRQLRRRQRGEIVSAGSLNAKFGQGGLVDAEYFIQILQVWYGHRDRAIQDTNTRAAAAALRAAGILSEEDFDRFEEGHRFLRALINGLRIVRGNAKDLVIPRRDSPEFEYLVRRLESFEHPPEAEDAWAFIQQQMSRIKELFASLAERQPQE